MTTTIGKRTVFVGPLDGTNRRPSTVEGICVTAATLPGMIMSESSSGLAQNANAGTVFGNRPIAADRNSMLQKNMDDIWTINENMVGLQLESGMEYNLLVVTGQALAIGTALTRSATAGVLQIAATDGTVEIVAHANEAVTTTATQLVCCTRA